MYIYNIYISLSYTVSRKYLILVNKRGTVVLAVKCVSYQTEAGELQTEPFSLYRGIPLGPVLADMVLHMFNF